MDSKEERAKTATLVAWRMEKKEGAERKKEDKGKGQGEKRKGRRSERRGTRESDSH